MALRRGVFTLVGGFSEGLGRVGSTTLGCEETELCIRYNIRWPEDSFVLVRDAVVSLRIPLFRCTWRYFIRRCWTEGLSKAAMTSLVGKNAGLSAERRHVAKAIPLEVLGAMRQLVNHPIEADRKNNRCDGGCIGYHSRISSRNKKIIRKNPVFLKNTSLRGVSETSPVPGAD